MSSVQMAHLADVRELMQDLTDSSQPRFGELVAHVSRADVTEGRADNVAAPTAAGAFAHSLVGLTQVQLHAYAEKCLL